MKKTFLGILISVTLSANLFAMEYEDSNLSSWRDGFISAYKALKLDTKLQGVQSKPIPTEKYIIYFDANKSDISDWDKIMVQMFGYSLSLSKPIRSVDGFIIFDSYNNKASAMQELELLNQKLFKGSEKYSLTLFENVNNKIFYSDTAMLMAELDGLKKLLENVNKIELNNKKKELENNQKVALVYVDEKTDKILNIDEDIVETDLRTNKKTLVTSKDLPKNKPGFTAQVFFGTPLKDSVPVYKKPVQNAANKTHEIFKDEIIEFDGKNGQGWYKLKNEESYIPKQFIKVVPAPLKKIENQIVDKSKTKTETPTIPTNSTVSKEVAESKDTKLKELAKQFIITEDQVIIYKLKNFAPEKNVYGLDDFSVEKTIKNDGSRKEYTHIITDIDGNKFIKLKNQNAFIDLKNAHIIK